MGREGGLTGQVKVGREGEGEAGQAERGRGVLLQGWPHCLSAATKVVGCRRRGGQGGYTHHQRSHSCVVHIGCCCKGCAVQGCMLPLPRVLLTSMLRQHCSWKSQGSPRAEADARENSVTSPSSIWVRVRVHAKCACV